MTDTDLRDLFLSAAMDPEPHDPTAVDRAWRDGSRRRVGARAAVVGSIAAAAAVVSGVTMLDLGDPASTPDEAPADSSVSSPTSAPTVTSSEPPAAERAGTYAGAIVWGSPSPVEESSLPVLSVPALPPVMDLDEARVERVGEPVLALFSGRNDRGYALTESQRLVELDLAGLDAVSDEAGNRRSPLSSYSLSPDRRRAFFIQESSLDVLDFVTGRWTTIDTPDWLAEGARWVTPDEVWVPERLGEESSGTVHGLDGGSSSAEVDWVRGWTGPGDEPWGPVAPTRNGTAQVAFTQMVLPQRISYPQALMVERHQERFVLGLDHLDSGGSGTRYKGCCLALGWLDADTVLFSSSSTTGQRILAWQVGTARVLRVSEILGRGGIAQLADMSAS
ncbi:hypothetical protein EXE58_04435 [Nocardioides seonyuensis]|uniref:Uncharacterized protein n=1 Tax=Nocardioides seonyuensis TaxID=2518371 RepID=A0A4P7IFL6_9ACTN|nr:hypothetical protein [Nocardioides seonyuensis]QBX54787.1 hypothetical protein EXE58_04435 [Nocardioides seonyuensis]